MAAKDKVVEAARRVLAEKFSTYKAANGRDVGVEGDDGEKCWIVHSDAMFELQYALEAYDKRRAELKALTATGG